jgi:hypothetical protein
MATKSLYLFGENTLYTLYMDIVIALALYIIRRFIDLIIERRS